MKSSDGPTPVQNLHFNFNVNGLGCNVMPSLGTIFGRLHPEGTIISNACINEAKYRNKLDLAKFSPMHRLLPAIDEK